MAELNEGPMTLRGHGGEGVERRLLLTAGVGSAVLGIEVVGGLLANSLALLSDAGHVFLDVFAIGLALYAARVCRMPADAKFSYGLHRVEIMAALVNGLTLMVLAVAILFEAWRRLLEPPEVRGLEMLLVAGAGLAANLVMAGLLHGHRDLNVRSAYFHILGDTVSSSAVLLGAFLILATGERRLDPALSALIGVAILAGAARLVREAGEILLERTPRDIDVGRVRSRLKRVAGVRALHDIHIWSLCSNVRAFSAHILLDEEGWRNSDRVRSVLEGVLRREYNIVHNTIQFERERCADPHEH
ncbi:MAG: cation diffusion facilitator family transporter [Thermoplasmatota archaeon]